MQSKIIWNCTKKSPNKKNQYKYKQWHNPANKLCAVYVSWSSIVLQKGKFQQYQIMEKWMLILELLLLYSQNGERKKTSKWKVDILKFAWFLTFRTKSIYNGGDAPHRPQQQTNRYFSHKSSCLLTCKQKY